MVYKENRKFQSEKRKEHTMLAWIVGIAGVLFVLWLVKRMLFYNEADMQRATAERLAAEYDNREPRQF